MENDKKTWSVVLTVHDEAQVLQTNLPIFLSQDVEVVVVDDASTDDTPDVLMRFKADYPNLYTTFLPKSPPNPWRRRLALTIGAKAAHGDWVILANIHHAPVSDNWLNELATAVSEHDDGVVTAYNEKKAQTLSCQWWEDLDTVVPLLRKTERQSGGGHVGSKFRHFRSIYDFLAVPRQHIHETLHYFDENINKGKLMELRFQIWWKNLMR